MTFEFAFIGITVLVIAYMGWMIVWERRFHTKREQELLAAVLAKDVNEYSKALEATRRTPEQTIKELQIENDLVLAAQKDIQDTKIHPVG